MRVEILRIHAEPVEPIHLVASAGFHQGGTLWTPDDLSAFFDLMTSDAGMVMIDLAPKLRFHRAQGRELERTDRNTGIDVMPLEIVGDTLRIGRGHGHVFGRRLRHIPAIALGVEWVFLP